jgi:hypothetical protein
LLVGDSTVEPTADSNPAGMAEAFQYSAANSGTSATINFYVDPSNAASAGRLGVYTNMSGTPGKLLGQASFIPKAGWDTVTLSGVKIISGRSYWLAELGTTGTLAFRDHGSGLPLSQTSTVGSTLPARWPVGRQWGSGAASFYVAG